jgi:urease accessory protein
MTGERRAVACLPAGSWPAAEGQPSITLVWADRHRRRIRLTDDQGQPFLLDLPDAVAMMDGDGLEIAGGGWIRVRAATEEVADVLCADHLALARLAWHLGNRHVPIQILPGALRIAYDHVLAAMLAGLGARVERRQGPFQPESGAYAHGHAHDAEAGP